MKRIYIKSRSLNYIKYDEEAKMLEVEFTNGGVYQYLNVPADEYEKLMASESKGTYLNKVIKTKYEMRKKVESNI